MNNLNKWSKRIICYLMIYSLIIFAALTMVRPFIYSAYWLKILGNVVLVIGSVDIVVCGLTVIILVHSLLKTLDL